MLPQEHRSFKSTRILVRSSDLTAKIVDAGLQGISRYCQQSRSKQLAAAFEWAAPELLLGERWVPNAASPIQGCLSSAVECCWGSV